VSCSVSSLFIPQWYLVDDVYSKRRDRVLSSRVDGHHSMFPQMFKVRLAVRCRKKFRTDVGQFIETHRPPHDLEYFKGGVRSATATNLPSDVRYRSQFRHLFVFLLPLYLIATV